MKMIYIIALILSLSVSGKNEPLKPALASTNTTAIQPQPEVVFMAPPKNRRIKAIAVIVHGLNLKPDRMDDWARFLAERGALTLRLALDGHRGNIEEMRFVSTDGWRSQIDRALSKAYVLGKKHQVPVVYMGYSLGGLLGVDWLTRQKSGSWLFDKMVLLAPAIATPWYSNIAQKILPHMNGSWVFPTPNGAEFRANSGSSINAYRTLFSLKSAVETQGYINANVHTLVLVDRNDELIPFLEVKDIIKKYRLSQWKLEPISNDFAKQNHGFRHLMADKSSVGDKVWQEMSAQVAAHCQLN